MYLSQTSQRKLGCTFHPNEPIVGICESQKCKTEQKIYCFKCKNDNKHSYCDILPLDNIPNKVEQHNNLYLNVLTSINLLESNFLKRIRFIKEILEGYQINEIFKFISEIEHLNSLGKIITTLPKVEIKINDISNSILKEFERCDIEKINKLNKFKNEDINLTILQCESTKRLIETQRIQTNERPLETNTSNQQCQNDQLKELLKEGEQNLKSLEYKMAIKCFEQALEFEPQNIQAKVGLMNTLQEMNYCNSSVFLNKKILENDSQNFDAVLHKGVMLYNQKKYSLSIAHIKSKLDNFSDPYQEKKLLKLLANNYLENSQFQNARDVLKKLQMKNGEIIDVLQGLAKCDLLEGNLKDAEKNLQNAILINRDDFENKLIQIQIFYKKPEYQKCLDLIEYLLQRQIKIKDKENLMNLKPFIYYQQTKLQEAMVSCQQFLENNRDDIEIQVIFGKCLLENKQYLLAKHFFEKVLSQNQDHFEAQDGKNKAQQKLNQQNYNETNQLNSLTESSLRKRQQNFAQSLTLELKCYHPMLQEAATILVQNNYPQVDEFLDECIRNFPLDEQLLVLKAKCYIQNIGIMLEYKNKAKSLLNYALTINPKNSEAKYLLEQISRPQTSTVKLQIQQ